MKQSAILPTILFVAMCVVSGCAKPTASQPVVPASEKTTAPGTSTTEKSPPEKSAPVTSRSTGAKNSVVAKPRAKKLSPEDALFNLVIAYQVEQLLEDADKKNCNQLSEYDADIKAAQEDFSAAYDRLDAEVAKASQSNGDLSADFAPARQALSDYQDAEKKINEISERQSEKRDEFTAVRKAWFESMSLTAQANNEFSDIVESSLNANKSYCELENARRGLEHKFVQDTQAANPDNKNIEAAAVEYEKIFALVESKTAEGKAASAAADGYLKLLRRQDEHRKKAKELLSKPVDASTEKAYEELRKEGQELAALESTLTPAAELERRLQNELRELKAPYYEAFKKVVLLVPMGDE